MILLGAIAGRGRNPDRTVTGTVSREEPRWVRARVRGTGVNEPGTYRLPADSAVIDLVDRAGGLNPGARTRGIPWFQPLSEDTTLVVPRRSTRPRTPAESDRNGPAVNLNRAGVRDLQTLPGVGPILARRIVEHRRQNGPYRSVEELRAVRGIGAGTVRDLRGMITLR